MVTIRGGGATPRDDGFVVEAESHPMSDNGYVLPGVCLTVTLSRDQRLLAEVYALPSAILFKIIYYPIVAAYRD